ncbi:hypothetical protein MASR2M70_03390 [Bacillota bacterium]
MTIKIGKADIAWGYFGQILYMGINIIMLPFVLKLLSEKELGLWYTFTSIGALANLLDFGFKTTITRNVAYAWGGANELPQIDENVIVMADEPNFRLLISIKRTAEFLYFIIGMISLVLLSTLGSWYVINISRNEVAYNDFLLAWIIYIIAIFFNIYLGYWMPLLKGIGAIKENYQAMAISKVIHLLIAIIGLLLGLKLVAIAIAYLVSSLSIQVLSSSLFNNYEDIKINQDALNKVAVKLPELKATFRVMWPNAYRQGLMSLSNYLADKSAILVCSRFYGLTASAKLGLTMQLLSVVSTIGNVLFNSLMPYIIQLKMKQFKKKAYEIITISIGVQSTIILVGGIVITFFANPLLRLIKSNSFALPVPECIILMIFTYFFSYQQICCSYIIAGNKMPMYKSYIITGVITIFVEIGLTYLFKPYLGIMTILLPQLLTQLAYNAWHWPTYVSREHGKSLIDLHLDSIKNLRKIKNKAIFKQDGKSTQ